MELFMEGLQIALTPSNFIFMVIGCIAGLIFAVIPGLTFNTAMVLFIPVTFGLPPISGITLLLGVFAGGMSGGAFPSILIGIPGTPSAAATILDGRKMALKGEAGKALGMAVFASVFGGLFSLLVLMLVAPQLAKVAIKFGPHVIFSLVIFGFSTIIALSGKQLAKGILSGIVGLLLCTVGTDPVIGSPRFVFGNTSLLTGIGIMPVMIGLFALPVAVKTLIEGKRNGGALPVQKIDQEAKATFPSFKEIRKSLKILIASSCIGTFLGAIPGMGGPAVPFIAYDQARRFSKDIGTGCIEGVAAPESSNNAVEGGSLIPLMTLGIPVSGSMAILMGVFLIHGLAPGPLLFQNQGGFVYAIFISFFLIYIIALALQFWGIKLFVKVLNIPQVNLMTIILIIAMVGAFIANLNFADILIMFVAGFIGYFMDRYGYSVVALILGLVLGVQIETNLRSAMNISKGDPGIFFTNPVSLVFLTLALFMLFTPTIKSLLKKKSKEGGAA